MPSHSLRLFNKIKIEYCCDGILFLKIIHPAIHGAHSMSTSVCIFWRVKLCESSKTEIEERNQSLWNYREAS